MLKRISFSILFLISYLPLFLLLFIQNLKPLHDNRNELKGVKTVILENILSFSFLGISLVALLLYLILIQNIQTVGFNNPEKVCKVKNTGIEYLSYLGTYIIPFIGSKFDNLNNSLTTILLLIIIGIIYPKTNLVYANPTLALFGYNIYKVNLESDKDEEVVIISKIKLRKNNLYRLRQLTDEIFYAKIK